MILTGCSGWSYSDWVDRFYPRELAQRHSEWLRYYARYFPTTEVNSTFYSMPAREMVESWVAKTEDVKGFEFSIKLPGSITHEKLPAGDMDGIASDFDAFRRNCITPLSSAGRLGAVLVQLPPQFGFSNDSIRTLASMMEEVADDRADYALEFRHRSWLERGEIRREAAQLLSAMNFTAVLVDSPAFPTTSRITAQHAYLRFHGRNRDIWYGGAGGDDMRINRYDYIYSRGQLEEWIPTVREISGLTDVTRIYFNNHGRAKAAKNALEMMELLGIRHAEKHIRIMDQARLGSFSD